MGGLLLKFHGYIQERILDVGGLHYFKTYSLGNLGPRVEGLVYTMTKAAETERIVLVFCLSYGLVDAHLVSLDFGEHVHDLHVRSSMSRSPKGTASCCHSSIKVRLAASNQTYSCSRAVLLMVCMEDQQLVEGIDMDRVGSVSVDRCMEHHIEKVLTI